MEFRCTLEDCLERCRQFRFHRYFVSMIYQRLGILESEYHFRFEFNKGLDYSGALESLAKVREALIELKSKPQFDEFFFSQNSKHWVSYQALSLIFNQFLRKLEQSGFQNSESSRGTQETNKNQSGQSDVPKSQLEVNNAPKQQKCNSSINTWFKSLQMSSDSGMRLDIFEHLDYMKELLQSRWKQLPRRKELQSELTIVFWYTELETLCLSSGRNEVDVSEFERGLDNFSNKLEGLRLPEGSLVQILAEKSICNALSASVRKASAGRFNAQDVNEILPMIFSNPIIKYSYFIKTEQQSQQQQQVYSQLLQQQQQLQQLSIQKTQSKEETHPFLQNLSSNQQISPAGMNSRSNSEEIYLNSNNNINITSAATCIPQRDSKNLLNSNVSCENPSSFSVIPSGSININNQTSQYLQSKAMISRSQLQSEGDFTLPIVEMDDSYKPPYSITLQMIECQTDLIQLSLSENIIITPNTVQLGANQPQPLRHKNIVCFGRQSKNSVSKNNNPSQTVKNTAAGITSADKTIPSEQDKQQGINSNAHRNMCGIQNDVQFKPEVWRVSRQQFRIVWNTMDYYSIVCTSPSNPTLLRLNEVSPVELQPNMVFRIADFKFLVNDLSHGTQDDCNELFDPMDVSPTQPRLIKLAHTPDSEMQQLLKEIPSSIQEINCLESSSQNIPHNNDLVSSIKSYESTFNPKNHQAANSNNTKPSMKTISPFIEISCISGDCKTPDGKDLGKVRFDTVKDREIITFGRDQRNKFPLQDKEVSRFHCQIVYDSQKRWKLCEKYIPDQKHLSSGGTFVQLQSFDQNKNEQFSDPWPLQEGMLIHSEGATFKVL